MKRLLLLLAAVFVLASLSPTLAQDLPTREYSPVQNGFQPKGEPVPLFAPDRIIVKFTTGAMQEKSLKNIPLQKGAQIPNAQTGLKSLDALLEAAMASSVGRLQGELKNIPEASSLGVYDWFIITVPQGTDIEKLSDSLARNPHLEYAHPDYMTFPSVVPNDAYYTYNWGHNNTVQFLSYNRTYPPGYTGPNVGTPGFDSNAENAWNAAQAYGNPSIIIAILDTGVDAYHADLLQVPGFDFGDNDTNPHDNCGASYEGHGTACAGIAAAIANNIQGAAGIAGGCSIMPLKIADSSGAMLLSYATNALYYAANNGAHVASMSFGSNITNYPAMDTAIQTAYNSGVTLLAATGNANDSIINYPAINPNVIAVGAASPCGDRKRSSSISADVNPLTTFTDPNGFTCDGEYWWGSNYGNTVQDNFDAVDVIAPTILPTTDITGSPGYTTGSYYSYFNGTSCAAPYAAGVVALTIAAHPTLTPAQLRNQLTATAIDIVNVESGAGWDRYSGYGMVDAQASVTGGPPIASFSANITYGCAPQQINFTNQSTGTITSYAWTFGDGGTSTFASPSHVYTASGNFIVSLTVSGPLGSNTMTMANPITIEQIPTADFSAAPVFGTNPLVVNFTDLSLGSPQGWSWDFGDGTPANHTQHPTHTYIYSGTYTVSLTAATNCGFTQMIKHQYIQVNPPAPPVAAFTASDTTGCGTLNVTFTDNSTGSITDWFWDFGDGQMSNEQNPTHQFMPGPYSVSLMVHGPGGDDHLIKEEYIFVYDTPFAHFAMSDTTGTAPLTVDFTDYSGMAETWAWNFGGDGSSTLQNPSHTFNTAGTYQVLLTVGNMCGVDTTSLNVIVAAPAAPVANFSANSSGGCIPLAVSFTDASSGSITGWSWSFGDGATSTTQSPSHTYTAVGVFDVSLQVTGPGGNDTKTVTGMVTTSGPPVAMFAVSDTLLSGQLAASFTDLSTGSPTSWAWNFGDGVTDTLQNPIHTYTADGTYTVTLVASNSCGSHTLVEVDFITVQIASATDDVVAARFELGQNYPNPFNPMTTIVFNLAKEGHARLEIYDATGRRVEVLVDENMGAGEHQLPWQPVKLSSGVYFSRFSANGQTATRRMVLLR